MNLKDELAMWGEVLIYLAAVLALAIHGAYGIAALGLSYWGGFALTILLSIAIAAVIVYGMPLVSKCWRGS